MSPPAHSRLEYLDSIRGVAALAVLVGHYFVGFGELSFFPGWLWSTPVSIVRDGFAAVAMFFVLSGLVLSLKPLGTGRPFAGRWRDLAAFYVSRLARILLPFLAVLWLSAVLQRFVYQPRVTAPPAGAWLLSFWSTEPSLWSLIKQSFLFMVLVPNRLLPHDWTLTFEINFSLLMPFLILIASHSVSGLLCFAVVAIALFSVDGFLLAFAMGLALAKYFHRLEHAALLKRPEVSAGLLAAGIFLYSYRYTKGLLPEIVRQPFKESWLWYVTEVGSVMILVAVIGAPWLQRAFSAGPLTYLGRISYSVYLWHWSVLLCVTPRIVGFLNEIGVVGDTAHLVGLVGTTAAVVGVSDLSYRIIEKPSIDLGRWLNARLFQRFSEPRLTRLPHADAMEGSR